MEIQVLSELSQILSSKDYENIIKKQEELIEQIFYMNGYEISRGDRTVMKNNLKSIDNKKLPSLSYIELIESFLLTLELITRTKYPKTKNYTLFISENESVFIEEKNRTILDVLEYRDLQSTYIYTLKNKTGLEKLIEIAGMPSCVIIDNISKDCALKSTTPSRIDKLLNMEGLTKNIYYVGGMTMMDIFNVDNICMEKFSQDYVRNVVRLLAVGSQYKDIIFDCNTSTKVKYIYRDKEICKLHYKEAYCNFEFKNNGYYSKETCIRTNILLHEYMLENLLNATNNED